jgi:hypothetical protein
MQRASSAIKTRRKPSVNSLCRCRLKNKILYNSRKKKTDERKGWQTMFFKPVGNIRRDEGRHIK